MKERYSTVSDCDQYSVWDDVKKQDLFPTRGPNRKYACKFECSEETAQMIADALNAVTLYWPSGKQVTQDQIDELGEEFYDRF